MHFGFPNIPILKAYIGYPFQFSPSSKTILPADPHDIPNISTCGDGLNFRNFSYDIKIH